MNTQTFKIPGGKWTAEIVRRQEKSIGEYIAQVDIECSRGRVGSVTVRPYFDQPEIESIVTLWANAPRLLEALKLIRDESEPCDCDHSTEDCCNKVNYFCAFCVSDAALRELGVQ